MSQTGGPLKQPSKTRRTILTTAVLLLIGFSAGIAPLAFRQATSNSHQQFTLIPKAYALGSPANYLTFQGKLTDSSGNPITTVKAFDLALYDAVSSGNLIYNETQSITPDNNGLFYITIGSGSVGSPAGSQSWPPTFSIPYWLAVRIGSSGTYLSPRIALSAAPYLNGQVSWGSLINFPAGCSAGTFVQTIAATPVCDLPTVNAQPASVTNTNTCSDTTLTTTKMMGMGVSYTTAANSAGSLFVTLTFDVKSTTVSNINTNWQLAYGTGAAPTCNAAATGTTLGQLYTVNTQAAVVLEMGQSVSVTISGLSTSTAYWFDLQVSDSSTDSWTYSLPTLSIMETMASEDTQPTTSTNTNANTCSQSSLGTLMAGFGPTYTTQAAGFSGGIFAALTFSVDSPATATGLTSKWQISYGTGSAPACNASGIGTPVGQQYTITTESATVALSLTQTEGFTLTGLAPNTAYWFDVQITDSTTGTWTYSTPTLAITEQPSELNDVATTTSSTTTCSDVTSSTALMMGLGTTYTTETALETGNLLMALSFDVLSPATSNINTKWQVAYGTGTAPTCNAAATGTTVGQLYTINTEAAIAQEMGQSITFGLPGLKNNVQYWFDVQATDSSGATWIYSKPTLAILEMSPLQISVNQLVVPPSCTQGTVLITQTTGAGGLGCARLGAIAAAPTETFSSGATTCNVASASLSAGFTTPLTFTTSATSIGKVQVGLTFNVASPATSVLTSKWQFAYGIGVAPACAATTELGTTIGRQYTIQTQVAAAGSWGQAINVVIPGLATSTTYWVDVQVLDSSSATWGYSNPAITVADIQYATNTPPNSVETDNANTCTHTGSATTLMGGLGVTYTTLSTAAGGSGNLRATLTFNLQSPATSADTNKWQVSYGTGAVPTCNASSTGTAIGKQYTVESQAAVVMQISQSEQVVINGLLPATTYWFDVQSTDLSVNQWITSLPTLSVTEQPADFAGTIPANVVYPKSAQTAGCATTTAATSMAGLRELYTLTSTSSGTINAVLTFNVLASGTIAAGSTSAWTVRYSDITTNTMPACAAAAVGTAVGQAYTTKTLNTVAFSEGQSEGFVITGLLQGHTYWFDVAVTNAGTSFTSTYSVPTLTITDIQTENGVNTIFLKGGAPSCTVATSASARMGGMSVIPTTANPPIEYQTMSYGSGNLLVSMAIQSTTATTTAATYRWTISYGTVTDGTANPACNAAATGTVVSNQYTWTQVAAVAGNIQETVTVAIPGLAHGAMYWFDFQNTNSVATAANSLPEVTITETN